MMPAFRVYLLLNRLLEAFDMQQYALRNIYRKPMAYIYLYMSAQDIVYNCLTERQVASACNAHTYQPRKEPRFAEEC